jgi:putative transposase
VSRGHEKGCPASVLCNEAKISRQAFYKERKCRERKRLDEERLIADVMLIRSEHPMIGTRKLKHMLKQNGWEIGRDRLLDCLRRHGLLIEKKKRKGVRTTDSRHGMKAYPNLIKDMEPTCPNEGWVSDITYVKAGGSFMYLSLITDSYSRKIVGFAMNDNLEASGCVAALRMALRQLPSGMSVVHHSDRGSQYCSKEYVDLVMKNGGRMSMAETGNCYENAMAERVNGILKGEYMLGINFPDKAAALRAGREAIRLYNDKRPHLSLNLQTPSVVHGWPTRSGNAA